MRYYVVAMPEHLVDPARVQELNPKKPLRPERAWVVYWMQKSQRARCNHALEYAIARGNELGKPLLVVFGLMDDYPDANARHYLFMLQGLHDVAGDLEARGIRFEVRHGHPRDVALAFSRHAALLVTDRDYLRPTRVWRREVAQRADVRVVQVESDLVVPIETASDKQEYAARTLRPKLAKLTPRFLHPVAEVEPHHPSMKVDSLAMPEMPEYERIDVSDPERALSRLKVDRSIAPVPMFEGGSAAGEAIFRRFLDGYLEDYSQNRNQPQTDHVSHMSKYLHFGQVSPLWLTLEMNAAVEASPELGEEASTYLEELLVRRDLAHNYCFYRMKDYDQWSGLPAWAKETLRDHKPDRREHIYTRSQLEGGETHDPYWNAAMQELRETGYMHNHMRMYWGKKVLEWTRTPEFGRQVLLDINNKYFIDGRDANSFGNVGWVFGLHDRPWMERPIFGKVRYMNAAGLERKAKPGEYVRKLEAMVATGETEGPAWGRSD